MQERWIYEANLRPFFEFAAARVRYDFDDLDWDAITTGLRATDVDAEQWFDYPVAGRETITVSIADDRHSDVVWIAARGSRETTAVLELAAELMQRYVLT